MFVMLLAGGEYEFTGVSWTLTGKTFWYVLAVVPYTTLQWNVSSWNGTVGLDQRTNYQFRVSAGNLNADGFGPPTTSFSVSPASLPVPVSEVVITNPGNTFFALNFNAPGFSLSSIFKVMIYDLTNSKSYFYLSEIKETSVILSGFLPGTRYAVKVFAGNLAGYETEGSSSASSITTTAIPANLTIRSVTYNSIVIFWSAPSNLANLRYIVQYAGSVSGTMQNAVVEGNIAHANLALNPSQPSYVFIILGGSITMMDSQALQASLTVRMSLNLRLSEIRVVSVSKSSVLLQWTLQPLERITSATVLEMQYTVQLSTDMFAELGMRNTRQYKSFVVIADLSMEVPVLFNATELITNQIYSCRILVVSPYGTFTSNIVTVLPTNQPGPVSELEISSVSDTSVLLKWLPPLSSGLTVTTYCVGFQNFTLAPVAGSACDFLLNGTVLSWNITGLVKDKLYTFSVRARNLNIMDFGNSSFVHGGPSGPPKSPNSLRLHEVEVNSLHISWEAPLGLPRPTFYRIQYKALTAQQGTQYFNAGDTESTTYSVLLLAPNTAYSVRICALGKSILGLVESACSDILVAITSPPPLPVQIISERVTNNSVTLSWSQANNGDFSWVFIPNKNSIGFDLLCINGSVSVLKEACGRNPLCSGFVTNGCLKSRIGYDNELVAIHESATAVGECCSNASTAAGCPREAGGYIQNLVCGCECAGIWKKGVQYLLQRNSDSDSRVFTTVQLGVYGELATSLSRNENCSVTCSSCPNSCVTITGLTQNSLYRFRVLVRNLNKRGFSDSSSNIVGARPVSSPRGSVTDLRIYYTTRNSVRLRWTGIVGEDITQYRFQIGASNHTSEQSDVMWYSDTATLYGSSVTFTEYNHVDGQNIGDIENLVAGGKYWFRLQARNLNDMGYQNAQVSNAVSAIPYGPIGQVSGVEVVQVSSTSLNDCCSCCTFCASLVNSALECCQCCGSAVCRGLADVVLRWKMPQGPVTGFRIQYAFQDQNNKTTGFQTAVIVDFATFQYTLSRLLIGRLYAFRVQAKSTNVADYCEFEGATSDCLWYTASECEWFKDVPCPSTVRVVPFTSPTVSVEASLVVRNITPYSVVLIWDAIISEPVTTYKIQYSNGIDFPQIRYSEVSQRYGQVRVLVQNLIPGLSYFFFVTPRNLNPSGYADCPSHVNKSQVVWTNMGGGTYFIEWRAPLMNGFPWFPPILAYTIWIRPKGVNATYILHETYSLVSTSSQLSYYVTGMNEHIDYDFLLTPSAWPCAMIGPVFPDHQEIKIQNFRAVKANETAVLFTWEVEAAERKTELLAAYEFAIANATINQDCSQQTYIIYSITLYRPFPLSYTSQNFTYSGLITNVRYCFRMRAVAEDNLTQCPSVYVTETPVSIPSSTAYNVSLLSRDNLASDPIGASVSLSWMISPFSVAKDQVKSFRIVSWLESDSSCEANDFYRTSIPCETSKDFFQEDKVANGLGLWKSARISGLRPGEPYFFKIFAGNLNGFEELGSEPLGPVMTSRRPGPVGNLTITGANEDSVELQWQPSVFPTATKQKLEYSQIGTGKHFSIEESCSPPLQPCKTKMVWANLSLGSMYVFTIYSGGPDDVSVPESVEYSGTASITGSPMTVCLPPTNLRLKSWDSFTVVVAFDATLQNSVLGYFIEGSTSTSIWTWTNNSGIQHLSPAEITVSISGIGETKLRENDGTNDTLYSFRVVAFNLNGNSTPAYIRNVRIFPVPTQVPYFRRHASSLESGSIRLVWSRPQKGFDSVSGSNPSQFIYVAGFQYRFESSEDEGMTFFEDIQSPLDYTSTDINVTFINVSPPSKALVIKPGRRYFFRISARNLHSGGYGPFSYISVFTPVFPRPVQALEVLQVSSISAVLSWTMPIGLSKMSFEEDLPFYVCEASVFSAAPVFVSLGGDFLNISQTWVNFTRVQVQQEWPSHISFLDPNNTHFWFRIRAVNIAGSSSFDAPMVEVDFQEKPISQVLGFGAKSINDTSITLAWQPDRDFRSLSGYRICLSQNRTYFSDCRFAPAVLTFENRTEQPNTQILINELRTKSMYWFEIAKVGLAGQSLYFSPAGPYNISSFTPTVLDLNVRSVTETSALLTWTFADTVCVWSIEYFDLANSMKQYLIVDTNSANITGLLTYTQYTFKVYALSLSGYSKSVSLNVTPVPPPGKILDFRAVDVVNGSVTLKWRAMLYASSSYLLTYATINADGDVNGVIAEVTKQTIVNQRMALVSGKRIFLFYSKY
jgi:hypothetical protein